MTGEIAGMPVNQRARDIVRESMRLRDASPNLLAKSLDDINLYVLKSASAGIKMRFPGISKELLAVEIKRLFA